MSGSIALVPPYGLHYLQELNADLAYHGLPSYNFDFEQRYGSAILPGMQLSMSKKSLIHRVQTLAIELEHNPNWTPGDNSVFIGEPIFPDLVREVFGSKHSHLIYYLNYWYGQYIPVDFQDFSCKLKCLPIAGSSINLVCELEKLAEKLDFNLKNYTLRYNGDCDLYFEEDFYDFTNNILVDEKFVLLELYTIALASIKYNLMIDIG